MSGAVVTDEMVSAAWSVAWAEGIQSPFMARVRDYPDDIEGLREADREAQAANDAVMRRVLTAALRVAAGTPTHHTTEEES